MARPSKNSETKEPNLKNDPANKAATPMMQQFFALKAKYPEAILLFRVGDFFETFGEDAIKASQTLGITLTARHNGSSSEMELAGFPHHSLDNYLPKLVRAGFRVAVCDQLEKPVPGRVVRRGITQVVTPGVAVGDTLLEQNENNFLATLAPDARGAQIGLSLLDLSTGELIVTEGNWEYIEKIIQNFSPSEIVFPKKWQSEFKSRFSNQFFTTLEDWVYSHDYGREKLLEHFSTVSLKGFGIEEMSLAQSAAGATLHYLATTENNNLLHINRVSRLEQDKFVWLDRFTMRNLELVEANHENGKSLLQVLNQTTSPMGARMLRKWVVLPLKNKIEIEKRLAITDFLLHQEDFRLKYIAFFKQIGDLERLISKVALGRVSPRELLQVARALRAIAALPQLGATETAQPEAMKKLLAQINPLENVADLIEKTIRPDAPATSQKGGVINDNIHAELDELRQLIANAQQVLLQIQQREIEKTGIPSLKIGFNNVFGYYIEVTAKYKQMEVPKDWVRKQTLANAERYISDELKTLEEKILTADERMIALEEQLFQQLNRDLMPYIEPIQQNAQIVAVLDCLTSFAILAKKYQYVKPTLNDGYAINITNGRHPVIEQELPIGEKYVPNDVFLDNETRQIMMITGPNMAGKSALLRQTALICLMAQIGSFVPAEAAELGLLDKIFTRVGASDNISSGESTFMVEMNETASIMNNVSARSLILLDEIGRGTSTYDGISIAWSIAEFLHDIAERPKTLFATHYHELNELAEKEERVKNFHVSTREINQKVLFLRKLTAGGSQHSFGIHVARMAGMPDQIVQRANEILQQLEKKHIEGNENAEYTGGGAGLEKIVAKQQQQHARQALRTMPQQLQLSIFDTGDPKVEALKNALEQLDLNTMTPIECMMKLSELKKMMD
ncbi:MAG: hypothetical protein RL757_238 [Bacteroidota bacterium]|jgi:DNA mismatch repair protein MutS